MFVYDHGNEVNGVIFMKEKTRESDEPFSENIKTYFVKTLIDSL